MSSGIKRKGTIIASVIARGAGGCTASGTGGVTTAPARAWIVLDPRSQTRQLLHREEGKTKLGRIYPSSTFPPEFLDATLTSMKASTRCVAYRTGKILTLFTRACWSDNVHASAVRCISWSTPMGLGYEHTDLFDSSHDYFPL